MEQLVEQYMTFANCVYFAAVTAGHMYSIHGVWSKEVNLDTVCTLGCPSQPEQQI